MVSPGDRPSFEWPHRREPDLRFAVRGERGKIIRIAGEDQRLGMLRSKCDDDRVGHRYGRGAPGFRTHKCCDAGQRLGHVPDLAELEQPVDMEVSAMVAREDLGQNDRWHVGWPKPIITEGLEAFWPPQ
jgi:hypothetical protein